jgi:hypothetical protein
MHNTLLHTKEHTLSFVLCHRGENRQKILENGKKKTGST